jgi:Family of unknown function (DUF5681)
MSDASRNPTDELGPGKPPKDTRWRKGRSGNPKGARKKSESCRDLLNEELDARVRVHENGKVVTLSKRTLWVKRIVNGAIKGDPLCEKILMMIEKPEASAPQGGGLRIHEVDSEDEIPSD